MVKKKMTPKNIYPKKIIISRTDNIGDVILTLPMAGYLKKIFPNIKIAFLGKKYTQPIVQISADVDEFYDWDEIRKSNDPASCLKKINADAIIHVFPNKEISLYARQANIKLRVGTNRRWFHWLNCNHLVNLSRKNSVLHESQLNIKLLGFLKIKTDFSLTELSNLLQLKNPLDIEKNSFTEKFLDKEKFNLILHPKTKGSAREWSPENFVKLINELPEEKFRVFVSGTLEEDAFIQTHILSKCPQAISVVGKFSLFDFIKFIRSCDGFVSASTGPLHIASILGKHALGIYPPVQSMSPSRWGPIGKKAECVVGHLDGLNCQKNCSKTALCMCINNGLIFAQIRQIILNWP